MPQHLTDIRWLDNLKEKKLELEQIREHRLKGALVRSRWQKNSLGEKPSKFFLNLENKNFVSKHIRELKTNSKVIQQPEEILEEMRLFYEKLYTEQDNIDIEDTSLSPIKEKVKKLNEYEKENLEKEISMEELGNIVKQSKNNKSPGPDGFSNEFYKIFWPNIKHLLLKLLNQYKENGCINSSQLDGIITCIPKGGKLRNNRKNWRPITLLNSIYKFYSGILAERIKVILPKIIHYDQKGFIKGRFIGENTRLTYDLIEECNRKKIKGIIMLIDFKKAFDSLSWKFITKTLEIFNFGPKTIEWVKSLQLNSFSKILQNGNFSGKISLGRGCRQGDPVSPYLFVIAAEILAEAVRSNKQIEGITIDKQEHKISQYADDTTLITKANENSIRNCMNMLGEFERCSSLKINKEKTKVAKIGGWGDSSSNLCEDLALDWTQEFTSLGIIYNVDKIEQITDLNIEKKIIEIQKLIYLWNSRNLTPYGKITIIKSLLISKITHVLLSLPSPNPKSLEKIEEMFKNFLWHQKVPKFRKEIMETLTTLGGLKMTNLKIFDLSLKISWVKRFSAQTEGWAEFPNSMGFSKILVFGDQYLRKLQQKTHNKFWLEVLKGLIQFFSTFKIKTTLQVQWMPLWFNSILDFEYRRNWYEKGYTVLGDILNEYGDIMTITELSERGLIINFLDYYKIKKRIQDLNITAHAPIQGPYIPRILFEIGTSGKGCSKTYNKMMEYNSNLLKDIRNKWELTLNDTLRYDIIENAFKQLTKMKTSAYYKYFQFKFLHSRTVTNEKLYKMGISDTKFCKTCGNVIDTMKHAFLECQSSIDIWVKVEQWLRQKICPSLKLSDIDKIFGYQTKNHVINKIILFTKVTIFNNRKDGKNTRLITIKKLLYNELRMEGYEANLNQNEEHFCATWRILFDELSALFAL